MRLAEEALRWNARGFKELPAYPVQGSILAPLTLKETLIRVTLTSFGFSFYSRMRFGVPMVFISWKDIGCFNPDGSLA
jgi:hypothetical protein